MNARFWKMVAKGAEDACWPWTGRILHGWYGDFVTTVDGRQKHFTAHRFAWSEVHGPIPDGKIICHRCDNPACCNPGHLFLGSQLDNERDKISKGRRPSTAGEDSGVAKLTVDQVHEIRRMVNVDGLSHQAVADRFRLARSHVRKIANGSAWSIVPMESAPRRGWTKHRKPNTQKTGGPPGTLWCTGCSAWKDHREFAPGQATRRKSGRCLDCMRAHYQSRKRSVSSIGEGQGGKP